MVIVYMLTQVYRVPIINHEKSLLDVDRGMSDTAKCCVIKS